MERSQSASFLARRWRFLRGLGAGIAVGVVTFRMMGQPEFMRFWVLVAVLTLVAAVILLMMRRPLFARFLLSLAVPIIVITATFCTMSWPQFWQSQIAVYEKADRASPPKPGVIVFTGSSSIRKWETLSDDMKPLVVINRGFGGSQLSHVNYYAQRIVTPYRPRAVVLYAGDNDLSFPPWKSPETVLNEFKQFVSIVHGDLPDTWIFYVSMKPAPWGDWQLMDQANRMIAAYTSTQQRVQFIDVSAAMLDSHGKPRHELYDSDPMHMNVSGYALWTSIVKPVLMERFGTK
jgi:lysophospholipase L1-like esterase